MAKVRPGQLSSLVATEEEIQKESAIYAATSTGTDTYAVTLSPVPSALTAGMRVVFKADVANTGSASLNVNSLGDVTIKKRYNEDLETNDILANEIIDVIYDGTNWQMQTPQNVLKISGTTKLTVGTTEPVSPNTGDLWVDTN